jgi:hypothetical protein
VDRVPCHAAGGALQATPDDRIDHHVGLAERGLTATRIDHPHHRAPQHGRRRDGAGPEGALRDRHHRDRVTHLRERPRRMQAGGTVPATARGDDDAQRAGDLPARDDGRQPPTGQRREMVGRAVALAHPALLQGPHLLRPHRRHHLAIGGLERGCQTSPHPGGAGRGDGHGRAPHRASMRRLVVASILARAL